MGAAREAAHGLERARRALFILTGLAIPFYAFPVFEVFHKKVDLATAFAGLLVLTSLTAPLSLRLSRASSFALAAAAVIPLAAMIPPRPPRFSAAAFGTSYGHWLLVVSFFFAALTLSVDSRYGSRLVFWNGLSGFLVASFALYQVVGIPRQWPATGTMLLATQREPLRFMRVGETGYVRPTSVFLEPAWLGGYLSFVLALLIAFFFSRRSHSRSGTAAGVVACATILVAILATVSWGAYVDLGAVLVMSFVGGGFRRGRIFASRRLTFAALGAIGLVIAVVALSEPGRFALRAAGERWRMLRGTPVQSDLMSEDVRDSSWARARNLRHTADLARQHPWRGIGLGRFREHALEKDVSYMVAISTRDPWCGWFAIAAELGVFGPLLLAGILLLVLFRARQKRSALGRVSVPVLVALAAVQQLHTGSYIDLWWWYPLTVAAVLAGPEETPVPA